MNTKKELKFIELTKSLLEDNAGALIDHYNLHAPDEECALYIKLTKEGLKTNFEFKGDFVSPTKNAELYQELPARMKENMKTKDKVYVIFWGWDGLVAGYFLGNRKRPAKDTLLKKMLN